MKKRIKKLIALAVILWSAVLVILIYPSVYQHICKNRVYEELEKNIDDNIMSANLTVATKVTTLEEGYTAPTTSYSLGASGVIIGKDENKYYAITASHVVNKENCTIYAIPYDGQTIEEYRESERRLITEDYYNQFPTATLEYYDENYDLAIISFYAEDDFSVLDIADGMPEYKEKIVTIGNPDGKRMLKSYGQVTSKNMIKYKLDDSKYEVIRHNAYVAPGSSGSAVLNEDMKIVGINIGGTTDGFGRYKYGVMIPGEVVGKFVECWEE